MSLLLRMLGLSLFAGFMTGCDSGSVLQSFGGPTMGSGYSVSYVRHAGQPDVGVVRPEVEAILAEVDQQMSTWRSDSDIERFNVQPANHCQLMPPAVLELIRVGEHLSRETNGGFDLTVLPLMNLWGFGPQSRAEQVPTPRQLARTLERVGYRHLSVDDRRLCKDAAVEVDLSSMAAGHTVDRIAARLDELGVHDYLVQVTGELKTKGRKPDGSAWRVALEAPRDDQQIAQKIFALDGCGVSTSGDYRHYFEREGLRYSHTLNALTGAPIDHDLASVTVIHPSALMADGLSTLLLILGPERGWDYAQQHQIAAFFVIRADKRFIIRSNPAFDQLCTVQSQ
ncbi:FAD:protein FMN transferase [Pseudomonas cichorii]|uniref:FAD:protein FMN transferase n=1 Tax=Pseudomonas cichorii TaxID=36746 RepID=UPI001910AC01|nr:FAD:protein FMN transferase [Pseudomonas cichorii]GFM81612.1 FAD:protein FMN transferase [Pseudomonas cichorii]